MNDENGWKAFGDDIDETFDYLKLNCLDKILIGKIVFVSLPSYRLMLFSFEMVNAWCELTAHNIYKLQLG